MTRILESTIHDLSSLDSHELITLRDFILSMKPRTNKCPAMKAMNCYLSVRESLKACKGSFSNDIIEAREDRI